MIVKTVAGSLGQGIFKVLPKDIEDEENKQEIMRRICEGNSLVEECIQGYEELQAFHPQSLNTIRVVTVFDGSTPRVFGSFFRMGRGEAVVDNAHAGGLYAHIDIDKGVIDTDAYNTDGEIFTRHPDTDLPIKGFQIPKWDLIKVTCIAAHSQCDNFMVGWDVTVNAKGEVDFIEGNHAPDMDLMQGANKQGLLPAFLSAYRRYRGRS